MFSPVVIPLLMLPIDNTPVRAGAKVTDAPGIGVNVLFGTVELYNCAVMVIDDPAGLTVLINQPAIILGRIGQRSIRTRQTYCNFIS